jgi:hypothetical protein
MADSKVNIPEGFVIDQKVQSNVPAGFVLDKKPQTMEERNAAYGSITAPPPWYIEGIRPTLQTIGLVGGGALGAASGFLSSLPTAFTTSPVTSPAGAAVGAGLGYAGMNQVANVVEQALGYRKPTSFVGEAIQSGKDILEGASMEAGGTIAGKAIGAISKSPVVQSWGKGGAQAQELKRSVDAAKAIGFEMTPAEESGKKGAMLAEKALSYIPGSAGKMQNTYYSQLQKLTDLRNQFIDQVNNGKGTPESVENVGLKIKAVIEKLVGGKEALKNQESRDLADSLLKRIGSTDTYESLGMKTQDILNTRSAQAVAKKNALYAEIGESIPTGNYETPALTKTAEQAKASMGTALKPDSTLMGILKKVSGPEVTPEGLPAIVNVQGVETKVTDLPPQMRQWLSQKETAGTSAPIRDWNTLQQWRANLSDLIKNEDLSIKNNNPAFKGQLSPEGRIYKQLKNALDKDLEGIAAKSGTDALDKLKTANAFYQDEYAPIWKNKDIQRLAYSKPETVVDSVFRPGNVTGINTAKKALGEQGFQPLKQKFMSKLIDEAGKSGEFSWDKLIKTAQNYGTETLHTVFTPQEWQTISTYAMKGLRQEAMPVADKFLLDVIKKSTPEQVVNIIFTKNNARNIALAKSVLPKDVFDEARAIWTANNLLKESSHGLYRPITSATQIAKMDTPTMKAIYSPEERQFVDRMFQVSKAAENVERLSGNPSGTAQAVITFQSGIMAINGLYHAAKGIATGDWASAAKGAATVGAITLAPNAMAKIYLSPVGRKLVLQGLKLPSGSPQAAALATKLLSIVGSNYGKDNKQKQVPTDLMNEIGQGGTP